MISEISRERVLIVVTTSNGSSWYLEESISAQACRMEDWTILVGN